MSSDDVPPARQCTMPTCPREAVDPSGQGGLCPEHRPDTDAGEGDDSTVSGENGEDSREEPDSPGVSPTPEAEESGPSKGEAALADAVEWFHARLDDEIADHTEGGEHPERPTTAREWFEDVRGFESETVDEARLGWAPPHCTDQLLAHLHRKGHTREEILASGVFTKWDSGTLRVNFSGRYVFPYFAEDGRPAYAIARCTGSKGGREYDGHPGDHQSGKYAKLSHTKEYVDVDEPIYGLGTLDRDGPVLITEGVADAIRAHEAGYACLSPVTTQFKNKHLDPLLQHLGDDDRPVYVVQDSEPAPIDYTEDADGWDALAIEQFGAGLKGGIRTAAMLRGEGVDAYVAEIPRMAEEKVDLDDYLGEWADTLAPVLAGAKPAEEHRAYDDATGGDTQAGGRNSTAPRRRETADSEHVPTTATVDRDLDRADVAEALSHVSKSLHYDDWVQLAYAVHDWDDSVHGKAVFERWARQSPKWADESQSAINWVWANATPGVELENSENRRNPTTVATLLHRASKDSEYTPPGGRVDVDHKAVLPPAVRDLTTATSGWDWKHAAAHDDETLSITDARERTVDAIADAYDSYDHRLIEALPTMGKSYGAVKAAARTGEPVTILTGRGRKEQYDQFKEWAAEFDLDVYSLPAFTHDCDTANGEHGEEWQETVRDWYRRGATPKAIHKSAEYVLGEPLPCQRHEGQDCPYTSKWDFDPDEFDILLGHYSYAHKSKVTAGRTVVFDEFPDAYEETLTAPERAISYWLSTVDGVPFEDYTDLHDNRDDQERRADALLWFDEHGVEADEQHVFDDPSAHADAPIAVFTLLAGEDLGNGFEAVEIDDVGRGVYNRATTEVSVLRSPPLSDAPPSQKASGIVALDGTPTKRMWELALGERLDHQPVLQQAERAEYIEHALNLNLVRSSDYIKSYNSADHVNPESDAALLEAIADEHGQKPSLITTMTAKGEYDDAGVLELVDDTKHYGNVLGSNEFDDTRLGAVIGSNHYGDGYIKKWGAYAGETVERGEGKGTDLSYGGFGDDVLTHMREHDTLQAAMRFGRDGNGAVVYVHTDTLPEWVPLAGEARVVRTRDDGERQVLDAIDGREYWSTSEIAEADGVDVTESRVRQILNELVDDGVLEKGTHRDDGRATEWRDAGIDELEDHVELPDSDFEDGADEESCGNVRSNYYYTWVAATRPGGGSVKRPQPSESRGPASDRSPNDDVAGGTPPG